MTENFDMPFWAKFETINGRDYVVIDPDVAYKFVLDKVGVEPTINSVNVARLAITRYLKINVLGKRKDIFPDGRTPLMVKNDDEILSLKILNRPKWAERNLPVGDAGHSVDSFYRVAFGEMPMPVLSESDFEKVKK